MEPLAYCRGQSRVVAIAHENICRRMPEEVLQRPLVTDGRQFEVLGIEDKPRPGLIEVDGRAEEEPIIGSGGWRTAAEVDPADRKPAPDQPAIDAMQDDPEGTVGEGGARRPGVLQNNLCQTVFDDQLAVRILEDHP